MKKLSFILVVLFGLTLSACSNPLAKPETFDAVIASHSKAFIDKIWPSGLTSKDPMEQIIQGSFSGITLSGAIQGGFEFNTQTIGKDISGSMSLSGSIKDPILADAGGDAGIDLGVSFISKSGSGYIKLDRVDVMTGNPQIGGMIGGFVGAFKNTWFLIDGEAANATQSSQIDMAQVRSLMETNQFMKMKTDLGREGGMYRYEVELDREALIVFNEKMSKALTGTGMNEEAQKKMQATLNTTNLEGTLSIDEDNREYGTFKGKFMIAGSASGSIDITDPTKDCSKGGCLDTSSKVQEGTIEYSFTSDGIFAQVENTEEKIVVDLKRSLTKFTGTMTVTYKKDNVSYPVNLEISKKGSGFELQMSFDQADPKETLKSGVLSFTVETKEKKDIVIEAPKDAKPISEAVGGLLGGMGMGGTPALSADSSVGLPESNISPE